MTSKRQCKLKRLENIASATSDERKLSPMEWWTVEFHYGGDLKVETGQNSRHLHLLHESLGMGRDLQ